MSENPLLQLILLCVFAGAGVLTWITYKNEILPKYNCSDGSKFHYCNKYVSGGIGEIISNNYQNEIIAKYPWNDKIFKCNLHHVNYNDYPIGTKLNIYVKKDDSTTCVTEEYNDNFINNTTKKYKACVKGFSFLLCIAYVYAIGFVCSPCIYVIEENENNQNRIQRNNNTINTNNNTNNNEERIHDDPTYFEEEENDLEANHSPKIIPTNNKNTVKQNVYKIPKETNIPSPPTSNNVISVDNKEECYKCLQPITSGNGFTIPPNCRHVVHTECYNVMVASGYVNCPMCEQKFI